MHVVSGLRANLSEERAINPVYDRSIHFTRPAKHSAIIVKFRDEDILHLQRETKSLRPYAVELRKGKYG